MSMPCESRRRIIVTLVGLFNSVTILFVLLCLFNTLKSVNTLQNEINELRVNQTYEHQRTRFLHIATSGDFDLYNGTPFTIVGIYFSTPDDDRWFPISGDRISPGETDHITFNAEYPCNQQLKVELSNGHSLSWPDGFNLCHTSRILIEPDAEGGYSAHYH